MSQLELTKINLTSTIHECLKEHEVQLTTEKGVVPMYLIEVKALSTLFSDFMTTYNGEVDNFKHRLARKVLDDKRSPQTYGVLVDSNLKYTFAFNRQFADLNSGKNKIVFKPIEDILLENSSAQDLSSIPQPPLGVLDSSDFDPDNTVIRYSLTGKKGGKSSATNPDIPLPFDKASLLDRVHAQYSQDTIAIGEDNFFVVNVTYPTNTLIDFQQTYKKEIDAFKLQLAQQAFGDTKRDNQYALLFDDSLRIKFVYNTLFASYDAEDKHVNYKPIEEVLITNLQGKDVSKCTAPKPSIPPRRSPPGGTVIRYSLVR